MELPRPFLVAGGGVVGAATRWAVADGLADHVWSLLIVNSAGAFLLGMLVHGAIATTPTRRLWLGVGFCGGLTTFSTLAVEVAQRLDNGDARGAIGVLTASLLLGIIAATAGSATNRWQHQ